MLYDILYNILIYTDIYIYIHIHTLYNILYYIYTIFLPVRGDHRRGGRRRRAHPRRGYNIICYRKLLPRTKPACVFVVRAIIMFSYY